MNISDQTLGYLIALVGDLGHSALTTFLLQAGAAHGDPGPSGGSRASRAAAALNAARKRGDTRALIACAGAVLNFGAGRDPADETVVGLVSALRGDGWVATAEAGESSDYWSSTPAVGV